MHAYYCTSRSIDLAMDALSPIRMWIQLEYICGACILAQEDWVVPLS